MCVITLCMPWPFNTWPWLIHIRNRGGNTSDWFPSPSQLNLWQNFFATKLLCRTAKLISLQPSNSQSVICQSKSRPCFVYEWVNFEVNFEAWFPSNSQLNLPITKPPLFRRWVSQFRNWFPSNSQLNLLPSFQLHCLLLNCDASLSCIVLSRTHTHTHTNTPHTHTLTHSHTHTHTHTHTHHVHTHNWSAMMSLVSVFHVSCRSSKQKPKRILLRHTHVCAHTLTHTHTYYVHQHFQSAICCTKNKHVVSESHNMWNFFTYVQILC